MSEEYGMLSTYGGRTNFPTVFEDLVIISGVMTGWADTAVPAHRFVAFDKKSGAAVWLLSTKLRPEDTTYSTPVFATFQGQAAMVVGAGDGAVYAIQPRTGKVIWKYQASTRGLNVTPLVDENGIVYCGHAEQNANDTTVLGLCSHSTETQLAIFPRISCCGRFRDAMSDEVAQSRWVIESTSSKMVVRCWRSMPSQEVGWAEEAWSSHVRKPRAWRWQDLRS